MLSLLLVQIEVDGANTPADCPDNSPTTFIDVKA
jgi:hypothetical protein